MPLKVQELSPEVAKLRASLILEEALETIAALGYLAVVGAEREVASPDNVDLVEHHDGFDLVDTVDGCADLSVVTTGTLSAMGVWDLPVLYEVDTNNLSKVMCGTVREDGKLIKPAGHTPPNFTKVLSKQGYTQERS